jgi:Tol biopolymer transport system component
LGNFSESPEAAMFDRNTCCGTAGSVRRISLMTVLAIAIAGSLVGACQSAGERGARADLVSDLPGPTEAPGFELSKGASMAAAPSPDGKQIVFSAQGALWIMPVAGGEPVRITEPKLQPAAPVWSPDGQTIAFQNFVPQGSYHIWTIAPDGSRATEITTGPNDDRDPDWLPDGSALVFSSDRNNDGQYKIWRVAPGGAPVQVTKGGAGAESNPAVSPDGARLAYVDGPNLMTMPLAGGTAKRVAAGAMPAWTPGSSGLVYQDPGRQLVVGGAQVTSREDVLPFPVRFLPDGRFLYTADGTIRVRDAAGANPEDLDFRAELLARRPELARR